MQIPFSILKFDMGKILAIDYGRKRMGIALADNDLKLAFALNSITSPDLKKLFSLVLSKIEEIKPNQILVGYPLGLDQKPTQMSNEIDSFISNLQNATAIEVVRWNEVGTSKIAMNNIRSSRNKSIDSEAARIILQEYLDFNK